MCECDCECISEVEYIDIINDLIYEYVKLLGKQFEWYFNIEDCDVSDNILTVFVDCFNQYGFRTELEYVEYLQKFYEKCEIFTSWVNYKMPKIVKMSYWYQAYDVEDETITGEYYESCLLEFKIKKS